MNFPDESYVSAALASGPVVAQVERSGFVESVHRALVTVTAPDGSVEMSWGRPDAVIYPRSVNKPLQAAAMVRGGLDIADDLLALVCGSHSGEPFHLEGVRRLLADAGLSEADLQNTPDLPYDEQERNRWIEAGRGPEAIAQNCSGKHAGMLATCHVAGWKTDSYRDAGHPLQFLMRDTLGELARDQVTAVGVDWCGAPVMSLSMAGVARAFGHLAVAAEGTPEARVRDAMRAAPENVGGTRRDVTSLIRGVPGLIAKDGAEAVYAIGLPDGRGIALKIADGGQRARPVVAAAVLRRLGVEAAVLDELATSPVMGHGQIVGSLNAVLGEPTETAENA